jgi:hypothetical protein
MIDDKGQRNILKYVERNSLSTSFILKQIERDSTSSVLFFFESRGIRGHDFAAGVPLTAKF